MQSTKDKNPPNPYILSGKFWNDFEPADLIAIIVIIGGIFLTFEGMAETFGPLMLAVVAFYFGMKTPPSSPA